MQSRRALLLLFAGFITLLTGTAFAASGAYAQSTETAPLQVIRTTPADGSTLNAAPPEIILDFAEILPDIEAVIQLQNANKELLRTGQPIAFNNRTSLKVRVLEQTGLPAGLYTVTWLVRPKQGDPISNKFTFTLEAPDGTTTGTDVTDTTEPGEVDTGGLGLAKSNHSSGFWGFVGRMLGYIGLAGLAGALLLILLAWPEGVEYVLTVRHLLLFWTLGTVGDLLVVACVSADAGGGSLAGSLLPNNWGGALDSSYGKAVVIRFLAMAMSIWVARRPERVIDSHSRLLAVGGPALAIITYGWSRHPETSITVPFGILHMLAVSAWLGGVLLLVRVVLAGPGEADLANAVKKFRGIAMPALAVVVLTGLIESAIRLGGARNLFNTGFGKILILKVLAVGAMAFVGTANRAFVRARLGRSQTLAVRPAARLRKSMRTELMAGVFVLVVSGWLIGSKAPDGQSSDPASVNRVELASDDGSFKAAVTFGPRKVGALVEVHFELLKPKSLERGLITLTPNDVNVAAFEIPIEGTPKYGFGPDRGFTFPASGRWTMTITGRGPDGELPALAYQFEVLNQDGSDPEPIVTTPETPTTRETVPDTTEPVTTDATAAAN